jgi:hypothetical protein
MANYAVNATQLTENTFVFVRGKLGYARLTRLIEGAELTASDQRRAQNGMTPIGKPHTTATITEAEVVSKDPANPTLEDQFVAERRYVSKKNPASGLNYSIDSKGTSLPTIFIASPAGDGSFEQDFSGQELAQGLDVTLMLRVYKPNGYSNRGLALEQVIVNERVRYYAGAGVSQDELAARGIVLAAPPIAVQAPQGRSGASGPVGTEVTDEGLSFPAPVSTEAPASASAPTPAPSAVPAAVGAAPAATSVAAPAAAPAVAEYASVEETIEEKLARLEAENAAMKNAGSAIGVDPRTGEPASGQEPGITYQG